MDNWEKIEFRAEQLRAVAMAGCEDSIDWETAMLEIRNALRALRERDEKATTGLLEMIALLRMKYGEADDPRLPAGPGREIYEAGLREAREGRDA